MGNGYCSGCSGDVDESLEDGEFEFDRKRTKRRGISSNAKSSRMMYSHLKDSEELKMDKNYQMLTEEQQLSELENKLNLGPMNKLKETVELKEKSIGTFTLKPYQDNINRMSEIEGPYVYSSGESYLGKFNEKRQWEGLGRLVTKEGAVYDGQWYKGLRHGKGRQIFEDGDYYEGDWVRGKAHGEGVYVGLDGNVYKGSFRDDLQNGFGSEKRKDGSGYTGGWKKGLKHGTGTLKWPNNCVYHGNFVDDAIEGQGNSIYFYPFR